MNERSFPGPKSSFIANTRLMLAFNRDMLGAMGALFREYGPSVALRFGGETTLLTHEPNVMREVLVTQATKFDKDKDYTSEKRGLARFVGQGLLTSNGEFWRQQRKLVAPALHTKRIETYADAMVHYAEEARAGWRDGQQIRVADAMMQITLRIVLKTLFSFEGGAEIETVGRAMDTIQHFSASNNMLPPWWPNWKGRQADQATADLDGIIYPMIAARRASGEDNGDLLSMLLLSTTEDGRRMNDKQARDEAVTLFLAGHETTANTLAWTWYLLAQNPQVAARLHAELDEVLAGHTPTLADLKRLPYTEMVIKESMRLYPPAYAYSRVATDEVQIEGRTIPRGSIVGMVPYFAQRSPDYWEDPLRFMPERFSAENADKIERYAYLPFGAGPRVCIGNSFAMMEAQLVLATLAQQFTLELTPGQTEEPEPLITLVPKHGLPMTLRRRTPQMQPVLLEAVPV